MKVGGVGEGEDKKQSPFIFLVTFWKLLKELAENLGRIGMCLWCSWKDLDEQDGMEFIWQELD